MSTVSLADRKTPWHLWAVGIPALLWNGVGAYTIMMAQAGRLPDINPNEAAYYAAQPLWLVISVAAILLNNAYDIGAGTSRVLVDRGALIVTSIIVVLAILQLVYAAAMKRRAVLK